MPKKREDAFVYDRTLRELFHEVPKTLIKLLVGKEIKLHTRSMYKTYLDIAPI